MSRLQRVFLIGACILFAATIYSLFFLKPVFIIIFMLLHSMCLFSFCYMCYSDQTDKELSLKTYHQEVGMEIAEKEKEIGEITGQVKERDGIIERISSQMETLRSRSKSFKEENETLLTRIHSLEEEKRNKELELARMREQWKDKEKETGEVKQNSFKPLPASVSFSSN